MPQMAPSIWTIITLFVFILFLVFSCLNYYSCPQFSNKENKILKSSFSSNKVTLLLQK